MKIATGFVLCAIAGGSMAAEIRVLSAGAVEPGLRAAAAAFKKQTGNDVNITFNTAPEIRKRIAGGEAFDVVIAPPAALDEFAGKVAADRANLGRVGLGVAVRPGAAVPDISSADALKRFDFLKVTVEGHADERGTVEYNLALGERRATSVRDYLTSRGVRVTGTDCWSWDAHFSHMSKRFDETRDVSIIWEGHKAGREIGYCHIEKLHRLEELPSTGFTIACFPVKIRGASGGWTRAVAIIGD